MINFIKNLFIKDKNLEILRKNFSGNYKHFNDIEKAVLRLRLSGMNAKSIAQALNITAEQATKLETELIKKIVK